MEPGEEARETDLAAIATNAFEEVIEARERKPRPALTDTLCVMYDIGKEGLYFLAGILVEKINNYINSYLEEKR